MALSNDRPMRPLTEDLDREQARRSAHHIVWAITLTFVTVVASIVAYESSTFALNVLCIVAFAVVFITAVYRFLNVMR
jgi:hypothetical protein